MDFLVLQMNEKIVVYHTISYVCLLFNQVLFLVHAWCYFFQINITIIMSFEYDLFYYNILINYSSSHMQFSTADCLLF
mgnify:CR=1 FL=1